jgi:hypothetical protein
MLQKSVTSNILFFCDGSMHRHAPAPAALKRVPRQESLQARASSKAAGERLGFGLNEHRHSKGPDHVGTNADEEVQWCGGIKMVVIFAEAD